MSCKIIFRETLALSLSLTLCLNTLNLLIKEARKSKETQNIEKSILRRFKKKLFLNEKQLQRESDGIVYCV